MTIDYLEGLSHVSPQPNPLYMLVMVDQVVKVPVRSPGP